MALSSSTGAPPRMMVLLMVSLPGRSIASPSFLFLQLLQFLLFSRCLLKQLRISLQFLVQLVRINDILFVVQFIRMALFTLHSEPRLLLSPRHDLRIEGWARLVQQLGGLVLLLVDPLDQLEPAVGSGVVKFDSRNVHCLCLGMADTECREYRAREQKLTHCQRKPQQ